MANRTGLKVGKSWYLVYYETPRSLRSLVRRAFKRMKKPTTRSFVAALRREGAEMRRISTSWLWNMDWIYYVDLKHRTLKRGENIWLKKMMKKNKAKGRR